MSLFRVEIKGGRQKQGVVYEVRKSTHDDAAVNAATEALNTFRRHGHSDFPFEGDKLEITVEELSESSQ